MRVPLFSFFLSCHHALKDDNIRNGSTFYIMATFICRFADLYHFKVQVFMPHQSTFKVLFILASEMT